MVSDNRCLHAIPCAPMRSSFVSDSAPSAPNASTEPAVTVSTYDAERAFMSETQPVDLTTLLRWAEHPDERVPLAALASHGDVLMQGAVGGRLTARAQADAARAPVPWTPLLDAVCRQLHWTPARHTPSSPLSVLAAWLVDPARTPDDIAGVLAYRAGPIRPLVARYARVLSDDQLRDLVQSPASAAALADNPFLTDVQLADASARSLTFLNDVTDEAFPQWIHAIDRLTRRAVTPALRAELREALLGCFFSEGVVHATDAEAVAKREMVFEQLMECDDLTESDLRRLVARTRQSDARWVRLARHTSTTPEVWVYMLSQRSSPAVEAALAKTPRALADPVVRLYLRHSADMAVVRSLLLYADSPAEVTAIQACLYAPGLPPGVALTGPVADDRRRILALVDAAAADTPARATTAAAPRPALGRSHGTPER
jgi:hypothetical protein